MTTTPNRLERVLALSRDLAAAHRLGAAELCASVARGRFPDLEPAVLRSLARGLLEDQEHELAAVAERLAALWEPRR